jgi:phospholipid/cholesterol/gamma-HCH transport system substrate-binding protein
MKRRNEILVGIFVTVALVVLIVGTILLTQGTLNRGYALNTKFLWGQNLKKGQPVLIAGQTIGYVAKVQLKPGYLDVQMRIDDDQQVPRGSKATVKPVGIFGDVAVALTPPMPLPSTYYQEGDTVPAGAPTPDMAEILLRVDSIGNSVNRLASAVEKELVVSGGLRDLRRTIASTVTISNQLQGVLANQDRNVSATIADFRRTMQKFNNMIDSAMIDSTVRNVRTMTGNMSRLISAADSTNNELRSLLNKANSGRGSLGMLVNDTTMYTNTRNLIARLDSLVTDFQKNPKKYINLRIF